jgi:hypothetical protein
MYRSGLLVVLIISVDLFLSGCVSQTEYDSLQKKLGETSKELSETKDSLKKSQDQLVDLQAHRYQTFTTGGRTWRLDSAKGSSCVLLAADQDWKNAKTKEQSCTCEDFYRDTDGSSWSGRPEALALRARLLGCQ